MTRETRDALQALCTDLSSLAAQMRGYADNECLLRVCQSCERVLMCLNNEPLDPEFVPPLPDAPPPAR